MEKFARRCHVDEGADCVSLSTEALHKLTILPTGPITE
ncbi:hypothetical protein MIZ03_1119 [Rhodoferax lithotrophicus]|uniref:Uncharacterized protein n=1 Tax=Rhodoferax lithotrophicus TaxID=2798804 RepID=A0ABM7MJ07_9BURK|nr:hypothetical protein MIZ03_1119 [Rhodoferax sp. MIZ03]